MKQIDNIVNCVEERLNSGQTFCLKVNFSDLLERLTLGKFKKLVHWLNSEFYITNHCRPNHFSQMNVCFFWCAMLLVFLMASLPYRIARRACVHDEEIHLLVKFKLEFCPDSVLVLHFFSVDHPMPGRYQTNEKLYIERVCSSNELEALVCFDPPDNNDELKRSKTLLKTKEIKAKVATILEERKKKKNKTC